jgi:uncharacterized lipoprotein YajG
MLKKLIVTAGVVVLSACGSTSGGLKYAASGQQAPKVSAAQAAVVVGPFQDMREGDKNWLGVIRGGFGNHLKTLTSDRPVTELVQGAFADGLRARTVAIGAGNANRLTGKIIQLHADQMIRREGVAEVELQVVDAQGTPRLTRIYTATVLEGSALSMSTGVFASLDDLKAVLEKALSQVVDKALDDPDLRLALKI